MERRLDPEERALWARVMANVRPLAGRDAAAAADGSPSSFPLGCAERAPSLSQREREGAAKPRKGEGDYRSKTTSTIHPGETLDSGWDRKLARGLVSPDSTVDLHGLGLQAAYDLLDARLGAAIARGDRVLLLVTGRPPRAGSERPHARGAIRAAVGDWIAASRHAGRIAAVRAAHVRHGGAGALYLVLRRARSSSNS
ncbi:MAG TPA: Smr/MutS family protein [Sphingomonas sp.]|nr:Smr/MutS family protein [Sphingomonas sp.]